MPKLKTHSGAKSVSNFQKTVNLYVVMQISLTFLQRRLQNVKEVFVRQQLQTLQTQSKSSVLFLINKIRTEVNLNGSY